MVFVFDLLQVVKTKVESEHDHMRKVRYNSIKTQGRELSYPAWPGTRRLKGSL